MDTMSTYSLSIHIPTHAEGQRVSISYGCGLIGGPFTLDGVIVAAYECHGYGAPSYDIRLDSAVSDSAVARQLDMLNGVARDIRQTRLTVIDDCRPQPGETWVDFEGELMVIDSVVGDGLEVVQAHSLGAPGFIWPTWCGNLVRRTSTPA